MNEDIDEHSIDIEEEEKKKQTSLEANKTMKTETSPEDKSEKGHIPEKKIVLEEKPSNKA